MKLLITGGLGFIGSNFIRYILKNYPSYKIINLDKLTYSGNLDNLKDVEDNLNYKYVKGDICNINIVNKLVKEVNTILHFAAETHVDRSIKKPDIFIKTNIIGTYNLLEAARLNGNKRFCHISTDEVFGSLGKEGYFNENTPYAPRSPYSASKASSDMLVRAYFHTYKLPVTITNCSNNYGPYQFPEKLIPLFITNIIENKKIPLYGNGMNIRDWLYVKDHCEAIDILLHKGKIGETYCIGGGCEKTNIEIAKTILDAFGKDESSIEYVEDRKGHDFRYAIDSSKIKKEFGWRPKIKFEKGIKETIKWYKDNEWWWKKLKGGRE